MKAIEFKSLIDRVFFEQLFAKKKKKTLFAESGKIIVVFKKIKALKKM